MKLSWLVVLLVIALIALGCGIAALVMVSPPNVLSPSSALDSAPVGGYYGSRYGTLEGHYASEAQG